MHNKYKHITPKTTSNRDQSLNLQMSMKASRNIMTAQKRFEELQSVQDYMFLLLLLTFYSVILCDVVGGCCEEKQKQQNSLHGT